MKYLTVIAVFCGFGFTLYSCNNGQSQAGTSAGARPAADASDKVTDGKWSAVIDGQPVGGTTTDEPLQQTNAAFVLPDPQGKPRIVIQAATDRKSPGEKFAYFLKMHLPDQTGSWTISRSSPEFHTYSVVVEGANISDYSSENLTLAVTSLTADRVTGIFSGHFKLSVDPGNSKSLEITEGKFDMPMATSRVTPE